MKEQMLQMEARLQMSEISVGCLDGPTSRPRRRDKGSLSSQSPCIYLDLCDHMESIFDTNNTRAKLYSNVAASKTGFCLNLDWRCSREVPKTVSRLKNSILAIHFCIEPGKWEA